MSHLVNVGYSSHSRTVPLLSWRFRDFLTPWRFDKYRPRLGCSGSQEDERRPRPVLGESWGLVAVCHSAGKTHSHDLRASNPLCLRVSGLQRKPEHPKETRAVTVRTNAAQEESIRQDQVQRGCKVTRITKEPVDRHYVRSLVCLMTCTF